MTWYGVEPAVAADPGRAARFLGKAKIPLVRQYVARRLATGEEPRNLNALARALRQDDPRAQRDILRGLGEALAGRRNVKGPKDWAKVYRTLSASKDAEVRERVLALSVLFGVPEALLALRGTAEDVKADAGARTRALEALLDKRDDAVPALLRDLLDDATMRGAALRGLAHYDDPKTPSLILTRYPRLSDAEKADALSTLASRPAYALALLDAVEKKLVPRADVSAFTARQLASLNDQRVRRRLAAVWGDIRPTAKDKEKLLKRYLKLAAPEQREKADRSAGRLVWSKTCASCHTLFGDGGKIGPDLTGSQRANAEYVLHKVLDPNAVVPRDYQTTKVVTVTGRVLTGLVKQENDKVLTLQTATEEVRVLKSDIEQREQQHTSLMPEGQLATLSDAEVRDLLAYLAGKGQAPLPRAK
jgi:putative heme-binding domain-containing protein